MTDTPLRKLLADQLGLKRGQRLVFQGDKYFDKTGSPIEKITGKSFLVRAAKEEINESLELQQVLYVLWLEPFETPTDYAKITRVQALAYQSYLDSLMEDLGIEVDNNEDFGLSCDSVDEVLDKLYELFAELRSMFYSS
jgi:hypothetical protein